MEMPENNSDESMQIQAQHIWSMLDDMANRDPASYRKFIDKQINEGKEFYKPPQPHMVVQTKILDPSPEINLFINVMHWHRIPAPKSTEAPIPVMGGPMYDGKDEDGRHKIVSVAFHKSVLDDFGRDSPQHQERDMLINLAIDYLQDNHKLTISRHYTILKKEIEVKGKLQVAQKSVSSKMDKDDDFESQLGELEKTFGPMTEGCKDSLINQLSNISVDEEPKFMSKEKGSAPEIKLPGDIKPKKSGLIQELGETVTKLKTPEYELTEKENESGRMLVLKIKLPDVSSVSECELDIAKDDLYLLVPEKYELKKTFPQLIQDEDAKAKFSKKSATLTLNLPIAT